MNSNFLFMDGKCFLRNPANTNSVNLRAGAISGQTPFNYTFPPYNGNTQVLLADGPQTITGKTIDASQNSIIGVGGGSSASNKKSGIIQAPRTGSGGTFSEGMLAGHIDLPTSPVLEADPPPYGTMWEYATGTTSDTAAGLRYNITWMRRDYNPRLKCKIAFPDGGADHDFLFGFSNDLDITPGQNPIENTQSGFLVGYRASDPRFMVIRNGGSNSSTSTATFTDTADSANTKSSALRTIEIKFQGNQGSEAVVTIQTVSTTSPFTPTTTYTNTFSTNLPLLVAGGGSTASIYMRPVLQIVNRTGTNKRIWLVYMELEEDF